MSENFLTVKADNVVTILFRVIAMMFPNDTNVRPYVLTPRVRLLRPSCELQHIGSNNDPLFRGSYSWFKARSHQEEMGLRGGGKNVSHTSTLPSIVPC